MDTNQTGANPAMASYLDLPAVKRQKKSDGGYNSSAPNTGAYNSENDDGDELFANFVPDTPGGYQTQPTQILDRSLHSTSSPPETPQHHIVQVPASSPFAGRDNSSPTKPSFQMTRPTPSILQPPRSNLAMGMAPAGTTYRPPQGIVSKPAPKYITIDDDEDDGPQFQGGSSDEEVLASANIKPTTFMSKSANNSFGGSPNKDTPKANFMNIVQNAKYNPQMKPERAKPVDDTSGTTLTEELIRTRIAQIRQILPSTSILTIRNALLSSKGSLDDSVALLCGEKRPNPQQSAYFSGQRTGPITLSDDEIESPKPSKMAQPDMKRTVARPQQSINQKYASTQQPLLPKPASQSTPQKPKRRLVKGRQNPSSPAGPTAYSPARADSPAMDSYDSDSGVASVVEEDPRLEARVLNHLNNCTVTELIELTNIKPDIAELMINARPFKSLDAARCVENVKILKSGKKSNRAPVGDRVVDTALEMFQGYETVDQLVEQCGQIGKPLADEMTTWGFDVYGAQKDGELEITSLADHDSQRDSGINSPSSGSNSGPTSANGDDDVKVISRKRSNVKFLKKPEMMAETCVLKDYQVVGLNWLALMYRHKLSGILADEMGLGKTCQVIAFISHLMELGNTGPHLVICPGTTLENWMREFNKFSPDIYCYAYHGPQAQRGEMADYVLENRDQINVVITTYEMAASKEDNKFMRKLRPDVCVYDEGHYLKNVKSQRYQGLIKIPANFRLLLTGTPLQNNLRELVALLAFMLPSVFKEVEEDLTFIFKAKATTSDANHAALLSAQRIARARSMLTPFVLRRKKEQVMKDLPAKTSRVLYCELTKPQKVIYKEQVRAAKERARLRLEGVKMAKSEENNPMMQSRKASIHAQLFRRHFTDAMCEKMADILRRKMPDEFKPELKREHLVAELQSFSDYALHLWCLDYPCIAHFDVPELSWLDSGKVQAMLKLVKEYKANGDRVLIFSQFALVLDILEAVMNTNRIAFTRIDGSTKMEQRQSLIDIFTDDESITAFLLTTKAGGTGINLVAANKVILFDSSFNPQDDRQAENRAHRVGQTRPVEVVQLITRGTVEEKILRLGQSKLLLDEKVAGESDDKAAAKAEEAGELAVEKMLLEEPSDDDDEIEQESTEVADEEKPTPSKKTTIKLVFNKKPKSDQSKKKRKAVGNDGEEMLV